jgi:hypothetical protein
MQLSSFGGNLGIGVLWILLMIEVHTCLPSTHPEGHRFFNDNFLPVIFFSYEALAYILLFPQKYGMHV